MTGPAGKHLTEAEFHAFFAPPMRDITESAEAIVDIWPYVDSLDLDELGLPHLNDVHYVYRDALNRYDQILIGTGRFNALLVIVVSLAAREIIGHRVLDLNATYGVSGGHLREVDPG
ncbi:hypothetical protein [Brevundimonas sp.]|uniref:hypothetical protein n=1 Tax=Brevundimonas sp. TaxID=1871086 RepID=UPI002D5FD299|nr:hypothetical protein [Brevundimonas sp.]HYD27605.1 hypothetical protein [Brevundimonas sp.]